MGIFGKKAKYFREVKKRTNLSELSHLLPELIGHRADAVLHVAPGTLAGVVAEALLLVEGRGGGMFFRGLAPSGPDGVVLGEEFCCGHCVKTLLAILHLEVEAVDRVEEAAVVAGDTHEFLCLLVGEGDLGGEFTDLLPDLFCLALLGENALPFLGILRKIRFPDVLVAAPPGADIVMGGALAADHGLGRE